MRLHTVSIPLGGGRRHFGSRVNSVSAPISAVHQSAISDLQSRPDFSCPGSLDTRRHYREPAREKIRSPLPLNLTAPTLQVAARKPACLRPCSIKCGRRSATILSALSRPHQVIAMTPRRLRASAARKALRPRSHSPVGNSIAPSTRRFTYRVTPRRHSNVNALRRNSQCVGGGVLRETDCIAFFGTRADRITA